MNKLLLIFVLVLLTEFVFGQCTYNCPNNLNQTVNVSTIISCDNGDVSFVGMNSHPSGSGKVVFDQQTVTYANVDIQFDNGTNPVEFIIPAGDTVIITGNLIFSGQPAKEKFLTVEGVLIVGGNLNFGNIDFEIDGTGSIAAGSITGDGNTSCSVSGGGTGTCPTITADTCDPSSGGLCAEPGTVTPVELIFFSGNENKDAVLLNWATANEENFDYFQVQRAIEGIDFEPLGDVTGVGESFTRLNYAFEDKYPEVGLNYYRLKSVDLDGTFEYSEVILVKFTSNIQLEVSPNPTIGLVSIRTSLPITGGLRYEIIDQFGTVVQKGALSQFRTEIDLSNQPKGIYIIRLTEVPGAKSQRIILN